MTHRAEILSVPALPPPAARCATPFPQPARQGANIRFLASRIAISAFWHWKARQCPCREVCIKIQISFGFWLITFYLKMYRIACWKKIFTVLSSTITVIYNFFYRTIYCRANQNSHVKNPKRSISFGYMLSLCRAKIIIFVIEIFDIKWKTL